MDENELEHKPQVASEASEAPATSAALDANDDGVFFVALHYKGSAYNVPVQAGEAVASIFDFVQEVLDFPRENCKLICRGKVLRPDDAVETSGELRLAPGSKLMLIATSASDVSFVQSSRADPLVKGFVEEERDEQGRRKRAKAAQASAWGTKQDQEFCFCSIKAEFKYNTPTPYEAEGLLKKLATDPGIIEVMKTRKFKVGILTEMSPSEAQDRMSKRGTPNMDLLGYNQNAGEMIVLRLRTDNCKGFRPYHDLINTLLHELTHNVWGPHDHKFWALYGELKAQYMRFHRFWSHGGQAADGTSMGQFTGFAGDDGEEGQGGGGFGRVLGSTAASSGDGDAALLTEADRRARAALAAEARLVPQQAAQGTGFDFLNSGGAWLKVCPCGQVHPDMECPVGMEPVAVASGGAEAEGGAAAPTAVEAAAPAPSDIGAGSIEASAEGAPEIPVPESAEHPAPPETGLAESAPAETPLAETAPAQTAPAETAPTDMDAEQLVAVEQAVPEQQLATEQPATEGDSGGGGVAVESGDFGLSLSVEDLAALGLDGVAVWLERFSEQLRALCQRPGQPAARGALELLLKLVKNIVDSPYDAKFRRIRADNPRIRAGLLSVGAEAEALIALLGFEDTTESGQRIFVLKDATFDSVRLRLGQELLEKQLRSAAVPAH